MENTVFCQSCGMPLTDDEMGTNQDGSKNADYCHYCFKDGAFTSEETLEQMVESCIPFVLKEHPELTQEAARAQMMAFFPTLKRWAK